jgi:hypothetical protein
MPGPPDPPPRPKFWGRRPKDSIENWIDRLEQYCEGCGHYFIDVTAARDLQVDSHALAEGKEGSLSVCAHCWSIDAACTEKPSEGK